ncbi:DUF1800 family protein, partial [Escherichia coli]|nr:DUF1800 family protein [Escherichia coli]
ARNLLIKLNALFLLYAFVLPLFAIPAKPLPADKLTEDQKILHVLNRLGYGSRPGDFEKIKAIGIRKYIEQQLSPETIDDSVA